jgi:ornithine decarboxylase
MSAGRSALVVTVMVVLAGIDFAGALLAKSYADRHRPLALGLGVALFVLLFVVYALALRIADLSVVTMGWIVLLQVGLIAVDVTRYGLGLDRGQWAAVAGVLVLQGYLVLSTGAAPHHDDDRAVAGHPLASACASATVPLTMPLTAPVSVPLQRPAPVNATPYLVVDLRRVRAAYDDLTAALPDVELFYAVKANPAPDVLRTLVTRGSSFDVASPGEIDACLRAGASPSSLSYGNTAKKERDIAYAYAAGVRMYSFDDAAELAKLRRAAPGATLLCRIATSGAGADWALSRKFGCSPATATELLLAAARAGHPVGICFHVGSQQRDPAQWDVAIAAAGGVQRALLEHGVPLAVLDIGGGFPATYREPTPPIAAYGAAITTSLRRHLAPVPRVIAEPGRFLVADAGMLQTEVVLVADRGGRRWVHLDVGLFGGLAEAMDEAIEYRLVTAKDGGPVVPTVLAGPTCDSVDILYQRADYRLPAGLASGDGVTLLSTGAYTASYSSVGFNGLPPLRVECVDEEPALVG